MVITVCRSELQSSVTRYRSLEGEMYASAKFTICNEVWREEGGRIHYPCDARKKKLNREKGKGRLHSRERGFSAAQTLGRPSWREQGRERAP